MPAHLFHSKVAVLTLTLCFFCGFVVAQNESQQLFSVAEGKVGEAFKHLKRVCIEERNCTQCGLVFAKDLTYLKSSLVLSTSSLSHDSLKKSENSSLIYKAVYNMCVQLAKWDADNMLRTVLVPHKIGVENDEGLILATLYKVPDMLKNPSKTDFMKWAEHYSHHHDKDSNDAPQIDLTDVHKHSRRRHDNKDNDIEGKSQEANVFTQAMHPNWPWGKLEKSGNSTGPVKDNMSTTTDRSRYYKNKNINAETRDLLTKSDFVKDMRQKVHDLFNTTHLPIICSSEIAFYLKVDNAGRITEMVDSRRVGSNNCCGSTHCLMDNIHAHPQNDMSDNTNNEAQLQNDMSDNTNNEAQLQNDMSDDNMNAISPTDYIPTALRSFWINLTSGSCAAALSYVNATSYISEGALGHIRIHNSDTLMDNAADLVLHIGTPTIESSILSAGRNPLIYACEIARKAGAPMDLSLYYNSKQTRGMASIQIASNYQSSISTALEYLVGVGDSDTISSDSHPCHTKSHKHESCKLVKYLKDENRVVNEVLGVFNGTYHTVVKHIEVLAYEIGDNTRTKLSFLIQIAADKYDWASEGLKEVYRKVDLYLTKEEKKTLSVIKDTNNKFYQLINHTKDSLDVLLTKLEVRAKRLQTNIAEDYKHLYTKLNQLHGLEEKLIHNVEENEVVYEEQLRTALQNFKTNVVKEVENLLNNFWDEVTPKDGEPGLQKTINGMAFDTVLIESDSRKSGLDLYRTLLEAASIREQRHTMGSDRKVQNADNVDPLSYTELLNYFTLDDNDVGRISYMKSFKARQITTSDIEAQLLGWSDLSNPSTPVKTTVVSAIVALVTVLPIFILIEVIKRWRPKDNSMISSSTPLLSNAV